MFIIIYFSAMAAMFDRPGSNNVDDILAGKFGGLARDDACVGCKLVLQWRTFTGTIFCEDNNTNNGKKSVGKKCNPRKLVTKIHILLPPQVHVLNGQKSTHFNANKAS